MHAIARERAFFLASPGRYVLVEAAADIERAKAAGKLAVGLHFQGTNPVGYDVAMVEPFYRLGIRHMLIPISTDRDSDAGFPNGLIRDSTGQTGCGGLAWGILSRFGAITRV